VKIAFIIQRYGAEILGGSEYHCRLIAERLAQKHQVEVLTTCARDYITWQNEYPEGSDRVRGVTVRRFANAQTRDIEAFNRYSDWIFHHPHTRDDEVEWLRQQGPWCPALIDHLQRHHREFDALIFFTYLYAPTVLGLQVAPSKSILVPTAHDEPAIRLGIYREMFTLPAAVAYNTEVERRFLRSEFDIQAVAEETVGCGVELPPQTPSQRQHGQEQPAQAEEDEGDGGDSQSRPRSHLAVRGAAFRRRHRLHGPFVLYGGRIEKGKGCEELVEYFRQYHDDGGEATLVLMGVKLMPLPEEPWVRFAGLLSERERLQALEAATVVVVPSPFESLSLLALEAFAVGTPILANARSEVVADHCTRSNAGLFYADKDEFGECLRVLMADERLRTAMGRNGRAYIRDHYRWDIIMNKYERMMAKVRGSGASSA
jgi:glycosyltransferase involved in cell wall biosynthesis